MRRYKTKLPAIIDTTREYAKACWHREDGAHRLDLILFPLIPIFALESLIFNPKFRDEKLENTF